MYKKNRIFLSIIILMLFASAAAFAQDTPSQTFKEQMHRIFHAYSHIGISYEKKMYDVTDIHLKRMLDTIKKLPALAPQYYMDGSPVDKMAFARRINAFKEIVYQLRIALASRKDEKMMELSQMAFKMCVNCHEKARLDYLFRLPRKLALFEQYMHALSQSLKEVRINLKQEKISYARENIKLTNYYLELLSEVFPESGPSGIIADRKDFLDRIKKLILKGSAIGVRTKLDTVEAFIVDVNAVCAVCHEPNRIK